MLDLEIGDREYLYEKLIETKKRKAEELKKRMKDAG